MVKGGLHLSSKIIEITTELVHPILEEKNLELVDIEYVKEGKTGFYVFILIKKVVLTL